MKGEFMKHILSKGILPVAAALVFGASPVLAADTIVAPVAGQPYGAHEIWAHSEMGQSFVAEATNVKGGFFVGYSPESAALMAPNAPVTDMVVRLYQGEGLDPANKLHESVLSVDTTQNGFLDIDYAASGVTLTPGGKYTIGISSPYNRGWIVPSVCDYSGVQPTGAYAAGHPFFQGQMVTDETGICDNGFHMIDQANAPVITPTPTHEVTPTPAPSYTVTTKKAEFKGKITAAGTDSITVGALVVHVTPTTIINFNYQSGFLIGQFVLGKGFKNSDGSVTATKLEVK